MALGATRRPVQRHVVLKTLRLAIAGIVFGATASVATARLIASLLYATSPWEVTTHTQV